MIEQFDAIVVGAGPGGTSVASILGEAGGSVLLLDRDHFPREKTCGDGITYKCRPALQRLNRWKEFEQAASFRTNGYSLCFRDHSQLTVRMPPDNLDHAIYVLERHSFDDLLLRGAVRHSGVRFRPGVSVRRLLTHANHSETITGVEWMEGGERQQAFAPLVVDATGATSRLAVQVGAGNRDTKKCALAIRGYFRNVENLTDTIELYFDDEILPGYYWIFPLSRTTANVGCGTLQNLVTAQRIDLKKRLQRFCEHHPIARDKFTHSSLEGTLKGGKIPLGMDVETTRARNGFLMLGDAAAFVNPVTAEGISYALHSGIMAGEVGVKALEAGDCSAAFLKKFDEQWRTAFGKQFAKAVLLTDGLSQQDFFKYVVHQFEKSSRFNNDIADPAGQYETMVKLKCLIKAFV